MDSNNHSIINYTNLVPRVIATYPDNLDLAMAKAIGALTLDIFRESGDKHVHLLRELGLRDGHSVYDLACGCGRTAAALRRSGWQGRYRGADIIEDLVNYARAKYAGYAFFVHPDFSIQAADASQDIICSWSLFTHLQLEEIFLYAKDCHRALRPGGIFLFSFLTLTDQRNREVLMDRVTQLGNGWPTEHLDMFLDEKTIRILMIEMLGYELQGFIAGNDESATPTGSLGQSVAVFRK